MTGEGIGWDWAFPFCSWVQVCQNWKVEIFIPWHKIFASGATKDHFKQETYHPKLWLKQKEVWRHHFSAFPQSSTLLTLLSPVEASNSNKKSAKKSLVRNRHVFFSIHKSANSPTEKMHPNVGHWIPPLRVPPRHITLFKNLHQPISSTFGNNYIGVFGKSRSGFDVETQQTFHLMTSKGGFRLHFREETEECFFSHLLFRSFSFKVGHVWCIKLEPHWACSVTAAKKPKTIIWMFIWSYLLLSCLFNFPCMHIYI